MDRDNALFDPKLLRLLDLLHRTRSVTQAAELLGQSQPTVSIWLGRLRKRLDDPLFVRTPAGMMPTPLAQALIDPVREALAALQRLSAREAPFDPALAQRAFRRQVTSEMLQPLLAFYASGHENGGFDAGIRDALAAIREYDAFGDSQ